MSFGLPGILGSLRLQFISRVVPDVTFELLETLKLADGEYTLLHRHLERLNKSAEHFGIPVDMEGITSALQAHASQYQGKERRVRLLLSQTGHIRVESTVLIELSPVVQPVALAKTPISKQDWSLYHKTTCREVYRKHQNEHAGVFDVLLWNEDGNITEFTNGNAVFEIGGEKITPPRDCGLLGGTFRQELLHQGMICEGTIRLSDIVRSTQMWFINSVRGWVTVRIVQ